MCSKLHVRPPSLPLILMHAHIYILQRGTPPKEAMEKDNNQPHIILFRDEDDDSVMQQYFVCVEQELMLESSSLLAAIFFCVAAHYIFNLTYHRKTGDVWLFIQEKISSLPSKAGVKRNPSSSSHFSGIQRYFERISRSQSQVENSP